MAIIKLTNANRRTFRGFTIFAKNAKIIPLLKAFYEGVNLNIRKIQMFVKNNQDLGNSIYTIAAINKPTNHA